MISNTISLYNAALENKNLHNILSFLLQHKSTQGNTVLTLGTGDATLTYYYNNNTEDVYTSPIYRVVMHLINHISLHQGEVPSIDYSAQYTRDTISQHRPTLVSTTATWVWLGGMTITLHHTP